VISVPIFSAVVIMVIVTTLITPPVLKITLARGDRKKAAAQQS
jgi:Kef-type K+ transport system membrane component KefB